VQPAERDQNVLISIVIPTIDGREEWLARCVKAYKDTTPMCQIIVVRNEPTCGHAWLEGYRQSTGQYVHFTADDITPFPGWYMDAINACTMGQVPLANVKASNGNDAWCFSPLGDMGHVRNVLVPFLSREQLGYGGWLLPVHYGSDDWVTYRAVQLGMTLRECSGYKVTHHVAGEGRNYLRRHGDVKKLCEAMEEAGYLPPVYRQLEENLRYSTTGLDSVRINQLDKVVRAQLRSQRLMGEA
jgi:hypothetical protein